MSNWYLIHTKIRQERVALEILERQGFACFLPTILAEKLRPGVLQVVQEPLFPRYLFIRLGTGVESQSWAPTLHFGSLHGFSDEEPVFVRCDANDVLA